MCRIDIMHTDAAEELNPYDEWRLPTHRLGRRVLLYHKVDSTNTRAAALAGEPANDGLVLLADEQTAGRGQHGRIWTCAPGAGVLMSVLLFPAPQLRRPVILAAWAATSVCETIRHVTGLQARIKWPNDVLVRGRKVCGILIEQRTGVRSEVRSQRSEARGQRSEVKKDSSLPAGPKPPLPDPQSLTTDFTVAGIGLNVFQTTESLAEAGLPQAGSLAFFTGGPLNRRDVARQLIVELDEAYERLCQGDLASLEACWRWRTGLLGQHVLIECQDGNHRGRLRELSWDALILEQAKGEPLCLRPEMVKHVTRLSGK
jgi:BirA family biotin operon repressor/biotin-[acetyl-CoA-carboxylase] ligase